MPKKGQGKGQRIRCGPFLLRAPIGRGGMGEVWWGFHAQQLSPVAVKLLTIKSAQDATYREAFRNEVRAVAGLEHPHIVGVYDYGEAGRETEETSKGKILAGTPFLAMELVTGGNLVRRGGKLDWPELEAIILGLLDALAHAHARGVVHRDIKPGNVLLSRKPGEGPTEVKLTDFGLAHAASLIEHDDDSEPFAGGTPAYMAPEQFDGAWRDYGPWTDLYAFGCLVWALIQGAPPFGSTRSWTAKAYAHMAQTPPALVSPFDVPAGFESWLRRLLMKDPAHRYRRAADAAWGFLQLGKPVKSGRIDVRLPSDVGLQEQRTLPAIAELVTLVRTRAQLDTDAPTLIQAPTTGPGGQPLDMRGGVAMASSTASAPPLPSRWRRGRDNPSLRLAGAGLGLYGLRAIPLVDRQRERDLLWKDLARVRRSFQPRAVLLRGPAGCGKSRLAEWLCERADEVGSAIVLRATHAPLPSERHGLSGMLRAFFHCQGQSRDKVLERLEGMLKVAGESDPDAWHALTEVVSPALGIAPPRIRFSSDIERYVVVYQLLRRLRSERPVVVWLDDVHYSRDSLRFVQWLLDQTEPLDLLLVLTVTDEDAARRAEQSLVDELAERERVRVIPVRPLQPRDQIALVQQLLGLEGDVVRQVARRTGGNPLFAVQLVGDWVERGLLEPTEDGFTLKQDANVELPDDLHAVWDGRARRLLHGRQEEDGIALEIAAVLGQEVDGAEWLDACRRAGSEAGPDLLDELLDQRLAVRTDAGWRFVHPLLRESLERRAVEYDRLDFHHRVCADVLARKMREPTPPRGVAERQAGHLLGAGRQLDALGPLLRAVTERVQSGDYVEADALLKQREQAAHRHGLPETDARWGEGWLARFPLARRRGDYGGVDSWIDRAEAAAASYGWEAVAVKAAAYRGRLYRVRGSLRDAENTLKPMVPRAAALGDRALQAELEWQLGEVHLELGSLDAGEAQLREALAIYGELGDGVGEARVLQTLAECSKLRGEHQRAYDELAASAERAESVGYRWGIAAALNSKGDVARYMGRLEEAESLYADAGERFRTIGSGSAVYTDYNRALVLLDRGQHGDAGRVLREAMQDFLRLGARGVIADCNLALAAVSAAAGDWGEYDHHVKVATDLLVETGLADEDTARVAEQAAELALEAEEPERARKALALALTQWQALDRGDEGERVRERMRAVSSG